MSQNLNICKILHGLENRDKVYKYNLNKNPTTFIIMCSYEMFDHILTFEHCIVKKIFMTLQDMIKNNIHKSIKYIEQYFIKCVKKLIKTNKKFKLSYYDVELIIPNKKLFNMINSNENCSFDQEVDLNKINILTNIEFFNNIIFAKYFEDHRSHDHIEEMIEKSSLEFLSNYQ